MENYPKILNFSTDKRFHLTNEEIVLFLEVKQLLDISQFHYSLFPIWEVVITNLQRRLESFGIENFMELLNGEVLYEKNEQNIKKRWQNVDEIKTVDYALQLNLINHISHDLITSLYWMKHDSENEHEISLEEILSILHLLEKNLFEIDFKQDKRKERIDSENLKRRKKDVISTAFPSRTHQELMLKYEVKKNEETSRIEKKLRKFV